MIKNSQYMQMVYRGIGVFAMSLMTVYAMHSTAADMSFNDWLVGFKQEAQTQGISSNTINNVFAEMQPIPRVIKLDRSQPEFVQTFSRYVELRVTPRQVQRGQEVLNKHQGLLNAMEQQYGVPKTILTAFWGMETNYGATKGDISIPAALATLAYDGRRPEFFRTQLLEALRIIEAGHVSAAEMQGSWAGAMGHMQFMPSTFNAYGLDGDDDGRVDLWNSLPDVMNSAAYYLKSVGWRMGEPVAIEVALPADFAWEQAQLQKRLPIAEWASLGVKPLSGALPSGQSTAAIVLPQGAQGPAFMVFDNFDVIMKWNRSVNYALCVSQLADRIAGAPPIAFKIGLETQALSFQQMLLIQQKLIERGYELGEPDGIPGARTQAAVRQYQQANHLPADGFASPSLLAHMQNNMQMVAK